MAEGAEDRDWGNVLEESLRKKLRSQGMRTDFMPRPAPGPAASPESGPAPTETGPAPESEAAAFEFGTPVAGPEAPAFEPETPAFEPDEHAFGPPQSAAAVDGPASGAVSSGSQRGVSSAEMVVEQLKRSLGPRDEKMALDVLHGKGASRGWGVFVAAGAAVVLASAGIAFVAGRVSPGGGDLRLASAIAPPREAPFPAAVTPEERPAEALGVAGQEEETGPVFHVGVVRPQAEWVDLGGPLVELDRFPPRTGVGP